MGESADSPQSIAKLISDLDSMDAAEQRLRISKLSS